MNTGTRKEALKGKKVLGTGKILTVKHLNFYLCKDNKHRGTCTAPDIGTLFKHYEYKEVNFYIQFHRHSRQLNATRFRGCSSHSSFVNTTERDNGICRPKNYAPKKRPMKLLFSLKTKQSKETTDRKRVKNGCLTVKQDKKIRYTSPNRVVYECIHELNHFKLVSSRKSARRENSGATKQTTQSISFNSRINKHTLSCSSPRSKTNSYNGTKDNKSYKPLNYKRRVTELENGRPSFKPKTKAGNKLLLIKAKQVVKSRPSIKEIEHKPNKISLSPKLKNSPKTTKRTAKRLNTAAKSSHKHGQHTTCSKVQISRDHNVNHKVQISTKYKFLKVQMSRDHHVVSDPGKVHSQIPQCTYK